MISAEAEARELGHLHVGAEHLLLGLLTEHGSFAAEALESLGVTAPAVRAHVLQIVGPGPDEVHAYSHLPFTPRAKKVMELSLRESLKLGGEHVGPEHLLLGIVAEGESVALRVLSELGSEPERVRATVRRKLPAGPRSLASRRGVRQLHVPGPELALSWSPEALRVLMSAGGRALDDGRSQIELADLEEALSRRRRAEPPPQASAS